MCTDLELIAWNGQTEQRLALREVKKFSREGLELLVFDATGEALRLPILGAPRAEIDAFFAALKPAIAKARTLPIPVKVLAPASIVASEFKLELSPETTPVSPQVQNPEVIAQAKNMVLEPEKEFSFDLEPSMVPANTPATHVAPTAIADPMPQREMVFELGALITPTATPKSVPMPQPKIEPAPVLEPKMIDQAAQAWPEVFGSIAQPEPVKGVSTPVQAVTETKPMAETKPVIAPEPTSSPQPVQAPVSRTSTASSNPVTEVVGCRTGRA